MFRRLKSFVYGAGAGAIAMYYWDPEQGRRRRALLQDQIVHALYRADEGINAGTRDLSNRTRGAFAEMRALVRGEDVDDEILTERIRARIGASGISYPRAIRMTVRDGRATLGGDILADEAAPLIGRIATVRGLRGIENTLALHDTGENVAAFSGPPPAIRTARGMWQPGTRLIAALGGSILALSGLRRRGMGGRIRRLLGVGLLVRSVSNRPWQRLVELGSLQAPEERRAAGTAAQARDETYRAVSPEKPEAARAGTPGAVGAGKSARRAPNG